MTENRVFASGIIILARHDPQINLLMTACPHCNMIFAVQDGRFSQHDNTITCPACASQVSVDLPKTIPIHTSNHVTISTRKIKRH